MKKNIILCCLLLLLGKMTEAQIIDKFGVNAGVTYSNQLWDNKYTPLYYTNKDFKPGLALFFALEKKAYKFVHVEFEFGFIQKGFKNNTEIYFDDGTSSGTKGKNVTLNYLATDIKLKIAPFETTLKPYLNIGVMGGYLVSSKENIKIKEYVSGFEYYMYKSQVKDYNKTTLSGIAGLGTEFKHIVYIVVEYNFPISTSYNDYGVRIRDNCWIMKIGVNINKLVGL